MSNFKVAIGPMSREIVEGAYSYSHKHGVPLALIATKNQVGNPSGYVEGWNTEQFMDYCKEMQQLYPHSDVSICRDHCGPGFDGYNDLQDVYRTIRTDIRSGFDLIHIDFCKMTASRKSRIHSANHAILYAKSLSPTIRFEIGTDEITEGPPMVDQIQADLDEFLTVCEPEFYVVNTGSLTLENEQVGTFNHFLTGAAHKILTSHGIKLKEHNADWLTPEQIQMRRGIVDAVNIAPELGVTQGRATINLSPEDAFRLRRTWSMEVDQGKKWIKWLRPGRDHRDVPGTRVEAASHYHFTSPNYQLLRNLVGRERLIAVAEEIIGRYVLNLE